MAVQLVPLTMPHWNLQQYGCSKPHLQLLERHLIFSFGRGRRHNVKTVEIASAVSVSHEVAVCVLLNKKFFNQVNVFNIVLKHCLFVIVSS